MFATLARTAGFTLTAALPLAAGGGVLGPSMAKAPDAVGGPPRPKKPRRVRCPTTRRPWRRARRSPTSICVACPRPRAKGTGPRRWRSTRIRRTGRRSRPRTTRTVSCSDRQAEGLGRFEVEDQAELRGLLDGEVGELGALEIPVHVGRGAPIQISKVRSIARDSAAKSVYSFSNTPATPFKAAASFLSPSAFQWCSGSIASVTVLRPTRCTVAIEKLSVTRLSMNVLMARPPSVRLGVSSARSLPVGLCPHRQRSHWWDGPATTGVYMIVFGRCSRMRERSVHPLTELCSPLRASPCGGWTAASRTAGCGCAASAGHRWCAR
jgi:hypothetical protein